MSSSGKINAALAAAIIFLLLSSCAAYFAFARLHNSQRWVQHTRDVEGALDNLSVTVARAGRLRSEYVDSGDVSVLGRQAEAVVEVRNALAAIQRLTVDNVEEQSNYRKLAEVAEQRISLMDRAIELKRTGRSTLDEQAAINRLVLSNADIMDRLLRSMHAEEQDLLTERQKRESAMFSLIAGILATSMFLALVLFLIHHQLLTDQVSERMRAETAQRALSARLLTLQDEERRRFARELHDSVGQHLSALKMAVAMLQAKLPNDRLVQDCLKLLDDSIMETRTISHLLHPPLLDEAGLNSAMRWFVEGFAQRSGIEVTMDIQESPERLSDSIELVLFRVLQESLTNVHRHSGAKRADVRLGTSGNNVILKVKDYGRGLPANVLENLREDGTGGGVGLAGMMERIREIGGRLVINSNASGTEVVASVPARFRPQQYETPVAVQEV
ncbi:MAG: ATP-binding protein [Candidatus Sulfotelmatobacter sp.]